MDFYLAPLEGITGYIYRNAVREFFGEGIVKYFTPFIAPRQGRGMKRNEERDILPENNKELKLIPQILTKDAEDFLSLSQRIHEDYGYDEINLNAGCPSKTVTTHGKGAALLSDPEALDRLLDGIFSKSSLRISVKTRIGVESEEEFGPILEVYKRYPLSELIIHPRTQTDGYGGQIRMAAFIRAFRECSFPVIYNGDIFNITDYQEKMNVIRSSTPDGKLPPAVMLGRGLVFDPALARELSRCDSKRLSSSGNGTPAGRTPADITPADLTPADCTPTDVTPADVSPADSAASLTELRAFHDRIFTAYEEILDGDTPLLFHMKELWGYMGRLFPEDAKKLKSIRKATKKADYLTAVRSILPSP
ncbi:MAG: tRNA-dihydrouridine synthase family protein [Lachnospiraceae bacterium]|nr:tRNA-dihydrouridine synthase family protein [Lachnospiraceae bacterium]